MVKIEMFTGGYNSIVVTQKENVRLYRKYKSGIERLLNEGARILRSSYMYYQGTYDGEAFDERIGFAEFIDASGMVQEVTMILRKNGVCMMEEDFPSVTPKVYRKYGIC